jgi:IS5 family transposase
MPSIADSLIAVYCFVDDFLKERTSVAAWRRSPNDRPAFTDAEVITVGLMQGCLGVATLKQTYRLIAWNYAEWFPRLCSYPQWIGRLHALTAIVGRLIHQAILTTKLVGRIYLLDSKPIPLCQHIRNGRVRLLRGDGAFYGKNRAGWYFGYKLHALVHSTGVILSAILTPANWPDRDVAVALGASVQGGILLGDVGYGGDELHEALAEEVQLFLITAPEAGEKRKVISGVRERIETTFSQLWNRFVDRVYSRSWEGLWSTIKLKLLHFNLCLAGLLSN